MLIGARVAERIDARGLSQAELARRVGVSQQAIGKLIHGTSRSTTHLHKIARILGTTPEYLTGEANDPDEGAPPPPELTFEELQIIHSFRQMSAESRAAFLIVARALGEGIAADQRN